MSSSKIITAACKEAGIFQKEVPKVVYHYTSPGALNGILFDEHLTNDKICLFATHFKNLNDDTEIFYGLHEIVLIIDKLIHEFEFVCSQAEGKIFRDISIIDFLDKLRAHLALRFFSEDKAKWYLEDFKTRNSHNNSYFQYLDNTFQNHRTAIFVASFGDHPDNKRMWKQYAEKETGVCVAFQVKFLQEHFSKIGAMGLDLVGNVEYLSRGQLSAIIEKFLRSIVSQIASHYEQNKSIKTLVKNDPSGGFDLFSLVTLKLVELVCLTKKPKWGYEQEVRLFLPRFKSERVRENQYRVTTQGRIIPYLPIHVAKEVIKEIRPGTKCSRSNIEAILLMQKTKELF